ncbi:MAG: preprotein translocase subunit SecA, partial [Paraclostridium sp.]
MATLGSIFKLSDKMVLKNIEQIVDEIDAIEDEIRALSDEDLKLKTTIFKNRLAEGETLDNILVEAFAVVREVSRRILGMKQYRVQLIGGIVLHQGKISEMKTGEGKTLVAVAPVYLNALSGKGVHVVTVNDYLAKRDKELMQPVYEFLGMSVGVILQGQQPNERRQQYNCDITYGTNNEYGFDYLRDNMVMKKEDMVQRELNFAIVDEVDSILIDEARTPLIISGPVFQDEKIYRIINVFIKMLLPTDYTLDEKDKTISLTESGIIKAEKFLKVDNLMDIENIELYHHINQALRADVIMKIDIDYVVQNGEIMIVDEFTGRTMEGRRYSEGLHQAIEAKENVEIKNESKTLATITYQNYFRMYEKLSGMTGTGKSEEEEFRSIYKMDVVQIPTNKPILRSDLQDKLYKSEMAKYNAIIKAVDTIHLSGQPVLIGTTSIEKSEILSYLLNKKGLKHELLNAKNHEREAEIISKAGKLGAITIATNMAGRGTDISLGAGDKEEEKKVKSIGGLYIIGTERNENRRIDDQLRGRSGRQGDPGVSRFYISLEDDMIKLFGGSKIQKISEQLDESEELTHKLLTKAVENSQKLIESKNFEIRKHVLKYDDVINQQRKIIYEDRRSILTKDSVSIEIKNMIDDICSNIITEFEKDNNIIQLIDKIEEIFNIQLD